jgi:hypothetical protein
MCGVSTGILKLVKLRHRLSVSHVEIDWQSHLTLKGWNIPSIKHVNYLSGISDTEIRWKYRSDRSQEALRKFSRVYSLFRSAGCNVTLTAGSKMGRLQVGGAAVVCKTYVWRAICGVSWKFPQMYSWLSADAALLVSYSFLALSLQSCGVY